MGNYRDIKIADFGLSRETDNYPDSATRLPIRWMAVEILRRETYSTKADVWSLGVVFWEIWSLGEEPYKSWTADFEDRIKRGDRLEKPELCPLNLYETVIQKCWLHNPDDRPTFAVVHRK